MPYMKTLTINGVQYEIDAAPGGYGIGELTSYPVSGDEEIDNTLIAQINELSSQTFKRIVLSFNTDDNFMNCGGHWYTDIYKLSTNYAIVTIKSYQLGGCTVQRTFIDGVLNPWEWDNPPMNSGVEYRTTERWNGYTVYKKLVSHTSTSIYGSASAYVDYSIPHGITNFRLMVDCLARKESSLLPYTMTVGTTFVKNIDATNVDIRVIGEWQPGNWYFTISYIKYE